MESGTPQVAICCPKGLFKENGLLFKFTADAVGPVSTSHGSKATFLENVIPMLFPGRGFHLSGHLGHRCTFSVFVFLSQLYATLGLERLLLYGVL